MGADHFLLLGLLLQVDAVRLAERAVAAAFYVGGRLQGRSFLKNRGQHGSPHVFHLVFKIPEGLAPHGYAFIRRNDPLQRVGEQLQ